MWSKVPNNVVKWGKSQESVRKAESQLCEERRPRHWIRWNWEFICKVYFRDLDSAKTFSPTSKDLEPGNGRSTPLIGNSRIPRNERTEQQFTENKDAILHKHHLIISCTLNTAPQDQILLTETVPWCLIFWAGCWALRQVGTPTRATKIPRRTSRSSSRTPSWFAVFRPGEGFLVRRSSLR